MGAGNGDGEEEVVYFAGRHNSVGDSVNCGWVTEETVEVDAARFALPDGVGVEGVMAGGDACGVERRAASDAFGDGVVGGEKVCALEAAAFADVYLSGEMFIVGVFVFCESPSGDVVAEVGRQGRVVGGKP